MIHKPTTALWALPPIILGIFIVSLILDYKPTPKAPASVIVATTEEPKEEVKKEPEITHLKMIFAGDIMMDRGVRARVEKSFDGDYNKIFENINLKDYDIFFANLEGTISDKGADRGGRFSFHMDPRVMDAIKNAGVDIVSVANNHVGDWGRAAYIDSLSRLHNADILYTGGGMNKEEAENPTIIDKNGIKLGFLGFSDVGPSWMPASETKAGLLLAYDAHFAEIISNASKQVDYLIVSFHFGEEYKTVHNKRQEELAHKTVDNGAKIVIGHHPHVPQDTEYYKDSFIAYSLGNFIFDQSWSEATMKGMLLELTLSSTGEIETQEKNIQLNKYFQPSIESEGVEEEIVFE